MLCGRIEHVLNSLLLLLTGIRSYFLREASSDLCPVLCCISLSGTPPVYIILMPMSVQKYEILGYWANYAASFPISDASCFFFLYVQEKVSMETGNEAMAVYM